MARFHQAPLLLRHCIAKEQHYQPHNRKMVHCLAQVPSDLHRCLMVQQPDRMAGAPLNYGTSTTPPSNA